MSHWPGLPRAHLKVRFGGQLVTSTLEGDLPLSRPHR